MKTVKYIFILVIIIAYSCKKECPPFDRTLLCWIPNSLNDTLSYRNSQNDTISFIVNHKSVADDNTKYGKWDKYGCNSTATLSANELQNSDNTIRENILYSNVGDIYFDISFYIFDKRGEFSLFTLDINENVISSMIIDNHEYSDVIIFENDTIKYPNLSGFWKLIISKNIGIVKFYERENNNVWTLLE